MSKKILLLGFSDSVLTNAQQQLTRPDLEVFRGKSVEDVRSRLSQTTIDHVFIGGKLAVETHALCPGSPSWACSGRGVTGSSRSLLSELSVNFP